jgi:hypothetical protein
MYSGEHRWPKITELYTYTAKSKINTKETLERGSEASTGTKFPNP